MDQRRKINWSLLSTLRHGSLNLIWHGLSRKDCSFSIQTFLLYVLLCMRLSEKSRVYLKTCTHNRILRKTRFKGRRYWKGANAHIILHKTMIHNCYNIFLTTCLYVSRTIRNEKCWGGRSDFYMSFLTNDQQSIWAWFETGMKSKLEYIHIKLVWCELQQDLHERRVYYGYQIRSIFRCASCPSPNLRHICIRVEWGL